MLQFVGGDLPLIGVPVDHLGNHAGLADWDIAEPQDGDTRTRSKLKAIAKVVPTMAKALVANNTINSNGFMFRPRSCGARTLPGSGDAFRPRHR
jgi:hypothetical protein